MIPNRISENKIHADMQVNCFKAREFIESREGKMPNGVSVKMVKHDVDAPPLVCIAINTMRGNFATNVNLNQSYQTVSHEMNNVYEQICRIAHSSLNT